MRVKRFRSGNTTGTVGLDFFDSPGGTGGLTLKIIPNFGTRGVALNGKIGYSAVPKWVGDICVPQGMLTVLANCPAGFFEKLHLDSGIGDFEDYSSMIRKLDEFEKIVASENGRVSLVILHPTTVVAYFACAHPKEGDRWSKLGNLMYEFRAIEVSRNYRKYGIAGRLIKTIMAESFIEDKIAYMSGYSWHWDIVGSGYPVDEYRKVHFRLLEPYRFKEMSTNEPNISLRAENIFMARIGDRVSPEDEKRFRRLTFGMVA